MRILFVLNRLAHARHFDRAVRLLADRGHDVILASNREDDARAIADTGRNPRYATSVDLAGIAATTVAEAPVEPADLVGNVELACRRKMPQLFDLAFELGDRPLEFEEVTDHLRRASGWALSTSLRSLSVCTCV